MTVVEILDALDADVDRLCGMSFDTVTTPERLGLLARLESIARRVQVPGHALIDQLAKQASAETAETFRVSSV